MLFEGSYQTSGNGGFTYDVSNDGQRFLMMKQPLDGSSQINIVLNWFEELKERVPVP